MKARELIAELQKLSDEDQDLDISMAGCDCYGDCASVQVETFTHRDGVRTTRVYLERP